MIEEIHVQISGRVQGIGFWSVVNQYASKHKIKGFVRNLADGRVEICPQGAHQALQEFSREIQSNPGRG